jgi:protein-tyrosine phosphatase
MSKKILFLCTGNYYRSRFAELLFNDLAMKAEIPWRAESRGLRTELNIYNVGPISADTARRLEGKGIRSQTPHRTPIQCSEADLRGADRVIALKKDEHRRMLEDRFPGWPDRIEYWHVHDLDQATAEVALAQIEQLVEQLVEELAKP